ncbi:MAG TPA: hypothetical protein VK445_09175 [Dissulfurispiraceae bacterium]|nr:hypothetical protein [Dissulfurispiraceae bacterium]
MHSSTSSSEGKRTYSVRVLKRATALFLAVMLLVCAALEIGTRSFIYRSSASLGRINNELQAAMKLDRQTSPKTALIVGNSLLIADIDIAEANRRLTRGWSLQRFAIEQTTYLDWYFGIRKLFAYGSRPAAIIVCLEPRHLLEPTLRTDLFMHYLLNTADILPVNRMVHLTPTETSDLFFASTSTFYGLRREIRKNFLVRILPDFPQLTALITVFPHIPVDNRELLTAGMARLEAMHNIAVQEDTPFIFMLMPPVDASQIGVFQQISHETFIPIVIPLTNDRIDKSILEPDDYHLNEAGRRIFTWKMADLLKEALR